MDVRPEVRKRAPRINAEFTREALSVVRPINRQIGGWQSRVALLEALGSHRAGEIPHEVRQQAIELMETVHRQQQAFARHVSTLPQQVASEGRIRDTARALSTVLEGIRRVLGSDTIAMRSEAGDLR